MSQFDDYSRWLGEQAPRLILFARQWVPCQADAEDVFHTAFVKFWRERDRVRDPGAFLYSCVRTTAINWLRERGRRQNRERRNPQPLFATDEDRLTQSESTEEIEEALRKLSDDDRRIVVLRIWGELTFPQIGEVLAISPSTADTRYRAALKRIHHELEHMVNA